MEYGELYSENIFAGIRTYYLDVKEIASNDRYLVISDSRPRREWYV